jgi:ParB family chromosome partitioning protein
MPSQAHVENLSVRSISPNPHNPRRLFDEEPMRILKDSIKKLGILVPVTVYKAADRRLGPGRHYILLDGERRWRCAIELKLSRLPAIIVDQPSEEQNILTMFHIHNVREGWQLMPTALKLHTLMQKLRTTNERNLSELTKLSIPQIRRCKILLTYPKHFQNLMLAPPTERMKADFFIELHRIRGPALSEGFPSWRKRGDSKCVQLILDKYLNQTIKAVTEFRHLAEVYRASVRLRKRKRFFRELDRFLSDPKSHISDVVVPGATFAKEAKEIRRTASRLVNQLSALDFESISADETTISLLRRLLRILRTKMDAALLRGPRDVSS